MVYISLCTCSTCQKSHVCLIGLTSNCGRTGFPSGVCLPSHFSPVWFFVTAWTVAHQAPLFMGFLRQEYWSRLPCPPPRDLPDPGIESVSSALQADSLLESLLRSPFSCWMSSEGCSQLLESACIATWFGLWSAFLYFQRIRGTVSISETLSGLEVWSNKSQIYAMSS